jgi:membrane protease YdiL (CAAX protease family)
MDRDAARSNIGFVFITAGIWFLITEYFARLVKLIDIDAINPIVWAAVRMTLMLMVTYAYVRWYERRGFAEGFNFRFAQWRKNVLWAVAFFLLAGVVLFLYGRFVVERFVSSGVEASAATEHYEALIGDRIIEFAYVLYEGIVEVLLFIGFLLDRLERRVGATAAVLLSNVVFALWHYAYWRQGALAGTLMILFAFIAGSITSLNYLKTRNSLSPVICHTLIDAPNSIRELLGMVV